MKKRLYFNKFDDMKYISHLDLMRFIERIFKRAHIELKYSQGFHPRPKISFANPISLGTEAYNEPMDIEIEDELSCSEIIARINEINVLGFKIESAEDLDGKASIAEDFESINYEISGEDKLIQELEKLFSQESIIEEKEKKGKITTRDLKDRIVTFKREKNKIYITLINMSPNSFLNMLDIQPSDVQIKRLGYNKKTGGALC